VAVPRPPTARPGEPAPWAGLSAAARTGLSLSQVTQALAERGQGGPAPLPGDDSPQAWAETAPALAEGSVPAGVLVVVFEEHGECRVVLTRRASSLRAHRGEVSFPGGRVEIGESVAAAARREASEEVALDDRELGVLGWLHPVRTFSSASLVLPVVAALPGRPVLVANPDEVARVFDVALAELVADGVFHEERWSVPGRVVPLSADGWYSVWFFEAAGETIWGATARVLYELLLVTLGLRPEGR
jgi:8-oxo-dGTP pyrophosphatase MutT (NUDIX family)